MEVKYLGEELSLGERFFYCDSVNNDKVEKLLDLWKTRVIEMQDGESAYIAVEWGMFVDPIMALPVLKCFKAIKREEKVSLCLVEAFDPIHDNLDEEYWLWTFSEAEALQMSPHWINESCLVEYSIQEFIDSPIYSGNRQTTVTT